jgi:hypothetical protein
VGDNLKLTFADGARHRIDVDAGAGDATAEAIMARTGAYTNGWIRSDSRTWLNLETLVSIKVRRESDPQPFIESA